jgi:hypothetical protein
MAVTEPCRECGVLDALGRHAGTCPRALEMGLPRLADGEDPIDPIEEERLDREIADSASQIEPAPDPLLTIAREQGAVHDNPDAGLYTGLWMAYREGVGKDFDAVIFGAEIDALRYAVTEHCQVMALELGRSLVDQARADAA